MFGLVSFAERDKRISQKIAGEKRMSEYIVRETGYPGTIKQDDGERREK